MLYRKRGHVKYYPLIYQGLAGTRQKQEMDDSEGFVSEQEVVLRRCIVSCQTQPCNCQSKKSSAVITFADVNNISLPVCHDVILIDRNSKLLHQQIYVLLSAQLKNTKQTE